MNIRVFILSLFLLVYGHSWSMDFIIKPVRIFVEKGKNTAVFEITNLSDKEVIIESSLKKWLQNEEGEEILEDTEDVILIPPLVKLQPKQKQLIKLAYLGPPPENKELAFRMILRQLPKKIDANEKTDKPKTVLQIVYKLLIPVFIEPLTEVDYRLKVTPVKVDDKEVILHVENIGGKFTRIYLIQLYSGDEIIYSTKLLKYVLAGSKFNLEIRNMKKEQIIGFSKVPDKAVIILEDENKIVVNF